MAGELVLAAPERKRILRELLARELTWSLADREVYRDMITAEFTYVMSALPKDVEAQIEVDQFAQLIVRGVPEAEARQYAKMPWQKTEGQRERQRRRTFREAVTASDGALAVTTGLIRRCIICAGPFHRNSYGSRRTDSAYCSNACRQAAYRRRHQGGH